MFLWTNLQLNFWLYNLENLMIWKGEHSPCSCKYYRESAKNESGYFIAMSCNYPKVKFPDVASKTEDAQRFHQTATINKQWD